MATKKVNFAACGQVGFPRFLPPVAGKGGFPLKETPAGRPEKTKPEGFVFFPGLDCLVKSALQSFFCISPRLGAEMISREVFLNEYEYVIASFANTISIRNNNIRPYATGLV